MYAALLVSSPKIVMVVRELDREVDRLVRQAILKPWLQEEFREQRRALGRLTADYLDASRAKAGPILDTASVRKS